MENPTTQGFKLAPPTTQTTFPQTQTPSPQNFKLAPPVDLPAPAYQPPVPRIPDPVVPPAVKNDYTYTAPPAYQPPAPPIPDPVVPPVVQNDYAYTPPPAYQPPPPPIPDPPVGQNDYAYTPAQQTPPPVQPIVPPVAQNDYSYPPTRDYNVPPRQKEEPMAPLPNPYPSNAQGGNSQNWMVWGSIGAVVLIVVATLVVELDLLPGGGKAAVKSAPLTGLTEKQENSVESHAPAAPVNESPVSTSESNVSIAYVQTLHGSDLRLRAEPSEESAVLMNIRNTSPVIVLGYDDHESTVNGETGKWCKINYDGKVGWAWGKFIVKK